MYSINDIITRKSSEGATLWLSQKMVAEYCGVSEEYLRVRARPQYKQSLPASWVKVAEGADFYLGDTARAWRWGRKGGRYYYDYDRIPDRAPAGYRSMLPTKQELLDYVERHNLSSTRERDTTARNTLVEAASSLVSNDDTHWLQTSSGYQIDIATARDYAKALAWCRLIQRTVASGTFELYGVETVATFYELCAATLATLTIKNLKVGTAQSLRNKVATFPLEVAEQRRWVISGKIGNNNSLVVGKRQFVDFSTGEVLKFDLHQGIMYAAYMNIDNPQKESMTALYETVYVPLINEFDLPEVSLRSFRNHLTSFSNNLLMAKSRHGEGYYKKQVMTYCPTEKLSYAHSLFAIDGSGLLGYRYWKPTFKDGKRDRDVLNTMNLYTMLISDVSSRYIAGYSFAPEGDHKETMEMAHSAVKMAVAAGGNQTMFELVSDNHGAFTAKESKDYLRCAFNKVRTIERENSQGNPAEVQFKLFKKAVLQSQRNFIRSSHNVTSIEGYANTEMLCKEDYPTYSEVVAQLKERIDAWNNHLLPDGETPAQKFANKHPDCQPLDAMALRKINGTTTKVEVTRMRGIVEVSHQGKKCQYEIPHYATTGAELISKATGNGYQSDVVVVYDNTGADLYAVDGKYILSCPVAQRACMSHAEATEQSMAAREHHVERKREQRDAVADFERSVSDFTDAMCYNQTMQMGGSKESYNEVQEHIVSLTIADRRAAVKTKRKLENQEARAVEREQKQDKASIQANYLARLHKRIEQQTQNQ